MWIIKNKKIFIGLSTVLTLLSIVSIIIFGLNPSIDFKGGAVLEVNYKNPPTQEEVKSILIDQNLGDALVQSFGETGYSIKTHALDESERNTLVTSLSQNHPDMTVANFNSIGPSVGNELVKKSIISIILVSLGIIFFIAYAFRKVSRPVASWKYGIIAVVTLLHDVVITTGIFALLGKIRGAEFDTLFVVALLTVLGLSVSDTIVVFDRIRENIFKMKNNSFSDIVGKSLSQVFTRSINTSFTIILALLALFLFGPTSTKNFALVLMVGMFFGTYSSIFLASPLLTLVEKWGKSKK